MRRSIKSVIAATAAIFMCAVPTVSSLSFIPEVPSITASANYYVNGFADFDDDWTPTVTGATNLHNINLGHVDYELDSNALTAKVVGIDHPDSKIKIPARLSINNKYYKVTEIKDSAFDGKDGKRLPDGSNAPMGAALTYIDLHAATYLTKINNYAFRGCTSLATVYLPTSLTSIGDEAFLNCSALTTVTIPQNVTLIGYRAFQNSGLKTLRLERASAYSYKELVLRDDAFGNCKKLTSISNNVTRFDKIGAYGVVLDTSSANAFRGCYKSSITVGTSYRVIGYKEQFITNFKTTFGF